MTRLPLKNMLLRQNMYTFFVSVIFLSTSCSALFGSDINEHNQNVENNPFVQRLIGNSLGTVIPENESIPNFHQKRKNLKFLRGNEQVFRRRRGLSPSLNNSIQASTKSNKAQPAATSIRFVETTENPYDPNLFEDNLSANNIDNDEDEKEEEVKKSKTSSHAVWIVLVVFGATFIICFNVIAVFLCLRFRDADSLNELKNDNNDVQHQNPFESYEAPMESMPQQQPAPQHRRPTLAEKQRRMKELAPASSFTSYSQGSPTRKGAGRDSSFLTYGTWSQDYGEEEFDIHTSHMESFASPLDYLYAFCPAPYRSSNTVTETLVGDFSTVMSTRPDTDDFEEILL